MDWYRSGEGVEDQAESELELVAEVVAGLQDELSRHLAEVWVLAGGELLHDRFGHVGSGVGALEGDDNDGGTGPDDGGPGSDNM